MQWATNHKRAIRKATKAMNNEVKARPVCCGVHMLSAERGYWCHTCGGYFHSREWAESLEDQLAQKDRELERLHGLENQIGSGWALVNAEKLQKDLATSSERVRVLTEALKKITWMKTGCCEYCIDIQEVAKEILTKDTTTNSTLEGEK